MTTTTNLPFFGGELASFDPYDAHCYEALVNGLNTVIYDSTFSRCGILMNFTGGCDSPSWAAQSDFNFHAKCIVTNGAGGGVLLQFWNGVTEVFRVVANGGVTYTFYTLQGGALTSVGSITGTGTTLETIDIRLIAGGSGSLNVYFSGTNRLSVTGLNHSGFSGVTKVSLRSSGNTYGVGWSQIICDSISHVGDSVKTFDLDHDSATNTGFTGGHASINEIFLDDNTFINAGSANLVSTFYDDGLSLGSLQIQAVGVSVRAKCGGSGPQHLQVCLKAADGNHFSSSIALDIGYQACAHSWTTDPSTSVAWVTAAAAAAEGGAKSVT